MPRAFVVWAAWLAGSSWVGITLTQVGLFSAGASVLGGGVVALGVVLLVARLPSMGGAQKWIAFGAAVACVTLLPSIDTTLFSQDASIHRAAGRWLAREGVLAVPDPTLEGVAPDARLTLFSGGSLTDKRTSLVRVPGGVVIPDVDQTVAFPSFSHLLSVWVAIATQLLGDDGPRWLGVLFAFTAWWGIGLVAFRDGGGWGAAAALALLATWLPQHWFGRFLMPEILAEALVWSGVAIARSGMQAAGLDPQGREAEARPSGARWRGALAAGAVAGLCFGVATFARLERFWVFVPALLVVRCFVPPARWVLPPGALVPFSITALQGVFHLWWMPTDYGNRIYKSAQAVYLQFVLVMAKVAGNDGYLLAFLLNRVLPIAVLAGVIGLLWWGARLERRVPGSRFRPLVAVTAILWLVQLYSRGWPESFPVLGAMPWYIPWPVWGAVLVGLPTLAGLPGLEIALILEAIDQVVWGRVSPEQIWASRRLVSVALPVLALAAARGAFATDAFGRVGAYAARALISVALLLGLLSVYPVVGVPWQAGGREFARDLAEDLPPDATVLLVKQLDWLHLASALWLGEGRHAVVMRESGVPKYEAVLDDYVSSLGGRPVYVLAGAVLGPDGGGHEMVEELDRLPDDLRLERVSSYSWLAPTLEVTSDRRPKERLERRAQMHLYRAERRPDREPGSR